MAADMHVLQAETALNCIQVKAVFSWVHSAGTGFHDCSVGLFSETLNRLCEQMLDMSSLERVTTTVTSTARELWLADHVTETTTQTTTSTSTLSWTRSYPTEVVDVQVALEVNILVQVPLTCKNIHDFYAPIFGLVGHSIRASEFSYVRVEGTVSPNPDIAGIGVRQLRLQPRKKG